MSYNPKSKGSNYGSQHRHGTFKLRNQRGKQWIGGNQFVNAENDYGKPTTEELKKEPEKSIELREPRTISHSEMMQRLNYHRLMGVTH